MTISTKVLNINNVLYQKYKNNLFDRLNNIGYPVVLLGERQVTTCKEYQIHNTYTIYDDLVNNLNNYIDHTISNNNENNSLRQFIISATIINRSKLNIYLSDGGISELVGYLSENIVGLTSKPELLNSSSYVSSSDNIRVFNTFECFIDNVSSCHHKT